MPDFRAYCPTAGLESAEIGLSPEESHHLVVVNRAQLGDMIVAFDGRGTEWICELAGNRKNAAVLRVRSKTEARTSAYAITLAQALPKGTHMDAIVRKATEIGATRIVPLESERTQVHLDGERSEKKVEKWRTAAIEAAKQCGNPFVPEITAVQKTNAFLQSAGDYELKLIASLQPDAKSLKTVLAAFRASHKRPPKKVLLLIGPEGDFTPAEMNLSKNCGFEPITLGSLVLRCETAAVYALSVLSYELQTAREDRESGASGRIN